MTDLNLAKDAAHQRHMAVNERAAQQAYLREGRQYETRGEKGMAQWAEAKAASCERRAALWTQLADEIDAYMSETATPDPRLL